MPLAEVPRRVANQEIIMRVLSCLSIMAVAWVGQWGGANGEEPKLVIEKAIAAHGGKERLAGLKAIRMKVNGTSAPKLIVPVAWGGDECQAQAGARRPA
jgi:hypothetical protein